MNSSKIFSISKLEINRVVHSISCEMGEYDNIGYSASSGLMAWHRFNLYQ